MEDRCKQPPINLRQARTHLRQLSALALSSEHEGVRFHGPLSTTSRSHPGEGLRCVFHTSQLPSSAIVVCQLLVKEHPDPRVPPPSKVGVQETLGQVRVPALLKRSVSTTSARSNVETLPDRTVDEVSRSLRRA